MPPIPQCNNHKILNDHWRNVNFYESYNSYNRHNFCQNNGKPGWYRLKDRAGNKMPDYPPGQKYCNTRQPGKL